MLIVRVNGTIRRTHQPSPVNVSMRHNERWTARLTFADSFIPNRLDEIVIYKQDGTTPMFGGLIYSLTAVEQDNEGQLLVSVECVDWWAYLDWILVSGGYGTATVSLEQVLTDLVNNYLSSYGITLSGSQATGPTGSSPGLTWDHKWASEVIRDLTRLSGGWVGSISPAKVLEMVNPSLATPSAPYNLTDARSHAFNISWSLKSDQYANRVTLRCGGDRTAVITQSYTVTGTDVSNGYLDLIIPSTPTGGVSATLDTGGGPAAVTIGGGGSNFLWSWDGGTGGVPRVSAGTLGAAAGDIFAITYTAQYPFYYSKNAGVTPYIDAYYTYDDITATDAAEDMATGLLASAYQSAKELKFTTWDEGFAPGQILSVNLTKFQLNTTFLITSVTATINTENIWSYDVEAISGVYTGSPLDYIRSIGGGRNTGGSSSYTSSINTTVISTTVALGGATEQAIYPNSGTYERVVNAIPFVAVADMTCIVRAELWSRSVGIQVTARLYDLDAPAVAGTSSGVTATSPTLTTFTATLIAGHRYELQLTSNTTGEEIYGIGSLQSV